MGSETIDYAALSEAVYAEASGLIHERFEMQRIPVRLFYHVRSHTTGVRDRAAAIGRRMGLTERELLLVDIAACFHDTVQDSMHVQKDDGVVVRQRFAGQNEVASAHEAVQYMGTLGTPFSPFEKGLVRARVVRLPEGRRGRMARCPQVPHSIDDAVRQIPDGFFFYFELSEGIVKERVLAYGCR